MLRYVHHNPQEAAVGVLLNKQKKAENEKQEPENEK